MKTFLAVISYLLVSAFLASCQSAPYRRVQIGAEKGQVLHLLGSPHHIYRKASTDRWVYHVGGDTKAPVVKEIWFQDGRVVYMDSDKNLQDLKPGVPDDSDFIPIN